jgi:hypothetical protein
MESGTQVMRALAAAVAVAAATATQAAERGTVAEAKAMLARAVERYRSLGRGQALAAFTAKKAPFGERDLYVVCIDEARQIVANGGHPHHVGTSADLVKDLDGRPLGRTAWEAVERTGEGSVEYRLPNPMNRQVELKTTFFHRMEAGVLCGVGAFRPL